jgi:predicted RNA binding protein YcfA (HicA-like mRNA interferase family)
LPKLKSISQSELVKGLKTFGFKGPFGGGKHLYMIRGKLRLTIPNPHRENIGVDLFMRILRQAGIPKEKWQANQTIYL